MLKFCIGTLILNEMEWLPYLIRQHLDWEGLIHWVFVEAADKVYAETNPSLVSSSGLSIDGTTEFLSQLSADHPEKITHIKFGLTEALDPAQGKCKARSAYLEQFEVYRPDYFLVLDADEFYSYGNQKRVNRRMAARLHTGTGFVFKHREIWYPPYLKAIQAPRFDKEVTGGFWDIPYCRCWRWMPGLRYLTNHNTPTMKTGQLLDHRLKRWENDSAAPYMVHLGFASSLDSRAAKNRYYEARGEASDRKRSWYCESRAAFENWVPGVVLPKNAQVINYLGDIPECFHEKPESLVS